MRFAGEQSLHRLRGLYNRLREHPLLFVSRLAVASHPPDLAVEDRGAHSPVVSSSWSLTTPVDPAQTRERLPPGKRRLEHPLTEACPSVTEWITLNKSRDIHDNEVEIFQVLNSGISPFLVRLGEGVLAVFHSPAVATRRLGWVLRYGASGR